MVKIISGQVEHDIEIDVKGFSLPGVVLVSTCPECGEEVELDLGDAGMDYPQIGLNSIYFYHSSESADDYWHHEWEESIVINVSVSLPTDDE